MTDAPNPSAAKTGPVAWRRKDVLREGHYFADRPETVKMWRERGLNPEPLYAHPQPSPSVGLDRACLIKAMRIIHGKTDTRLRDRRFALHYLMTSPDLIDAILALAAPADGYVLVPVKLPDDMIEAYYLACHRNGFTAHINASCAWEAFLSALPAAPTGETGA